MAAHGTELSTVVSERVRPNAPSSRPPPPPPLALIDLYGCAHPSTTSSSTCGPPFERDFFEEAAAAAAAAAVAAVAAAVATAALAMASLRSLLQYTDTERKWLLAEDGDVERHLSPAGLRNAAVWRTTETFSAEPFTQGMMDAPDSALGMDLAYLVRESAEGAEVFLSLAAILLRRVDCVRTKYPLTDSSPQACWCSFITFCAAYRVVTPRIFFCPAGAVFLRQWPYHGPREHGHSFLHMVRRT